MVSITLLRGTVIDGVPHLPGAVVSVGEQVAARMIGSGRAAATARAPSPPEKSIKVRRVK